MLQQSSRKSARTVRSSPSDKENGMQGSPIRARKSPASAGVPKSPMGQVPASSTAAGATASRVEYEPQARAAMAEHAALFETLPGGMHAHVSPVPMPGMQRGRRTKMYMRNYPSPHSKKHGGYTTAKGDATDDTTRMKARAVKTAMAPGKKVVFGQMYDFYGDVYDGPHDFKAAEGSKTDFKPSTHFINKLSAEKKELFFASKIKKLQKVIVDAIVIDGHEGADCDIAGADALKFWPEWLEKALPLAIEEASSILGRTVSYDIARPPEALLAAAGAAVLKEGEKAPSVKDHEVQHECGALKCMSLFHRARADEQTRWMHRHALGDASVNYFKSLTPQYGEYSDEERKTLQEDAMAREGGRAGTAGGKRHGRCLLRVALWGRPTLIVTRSTGVMKTVLKMPEM